MYSTYENENEASPSTCDKIIVLGSGPNRIGQGIEFDYCCVHAAMAMREAGYETIMINCNPETVSTDYDISDRLYFEPLTIEDVYEVVLCEKPKGVIVQYGGQTPLKLASELAALGAPIIGTSPAAIERAEDRQQFQELLIKLNLKQPPNGTVRDVEEGIRLAKVFSYPIIARPSYVLGGRDMRIVYHESEMIKYLKQSTQISPKSPLLLDHFLEDAIEVDIDAICDGTDVLIGGILEHTEQAGVHSGDSSCTFPPHSIDHATQDEIRTQLAAIAKELGVIGLINAQFAIQKGEIYLLEVNPRASRTIPFIAKASGRPLAKIAARTMIGESLQQQGVHEELIPTYFAVKKPVFPFHKFQGADPILSPEMRSTGEVMGISNTFGQAFSKSLLAGGQCIPHTGVAFISVRDADKAQAIIAAQKLIKHGFSIVATQGTLHALQAANIPCELVNKVTEGRPHIIDNIKNGDIQFIINTTEGEQAEIDSKEIRSSALNQKVCYTTTLAGGIATIMALDFPAVTEVYTLQTLHCLSKTREDYESNTTH